MTIYKKPEKTVFASEAKVGEVLDFPDRARGWGVTIDQTNAIPPMEWFNDLQQVNDESIQYLLQYGVAIKDNETEYPANAITNENGELYICKKQHVNKPVSNPTYWEKIRKEASKTQAGVVELSSSVTSADETKASTPKATKTAYDKAVQADNNANSRVKIDGSTAMTGDLHIKSGDYGGVRVFNNKNGSLKMSVGDDRIQTSFGRLYFDESGRRIATLSLPKKTGVVLVNADLSDDINSEDNEKIATSKAVKTVNGKVNKLEQNKLDKSALSSSVTSTDETKASTPKATKTAYDKGVQADNNANKRLEYKSTLVKSIEQAQSLTDGIYIVNGTGFPERIGTLTIKSNLNSKDVNAGITNGSNLKFFEFRGVNNNNLYIAKRIEGGKFSGFEELIKEKKWRLAFKGSTANVPNFPVNLNLLDNDLQISVKVKFSNRTHSSVLPLYQKLNSQTEIIQSTAEYEIKATKITANILKISSDFKSVPILEVWVKDEK